ncbi:tetratricopeptide repeat protein [candidate division KSB1 bacterium]
MSLGKRVFNTKFYAIVFIVTLVFSAQIFAQTIDEAQKLFDQEKFQEAEVILLQILDQNDKDLTANFLLGKVNLELKEYERAEKYIRKTVDIDKNFADGYYVLGMIEMSKPRSLLASKTKEAMNHFNKALEIDPSHGDSKMAIFEAYFENEEPQEALEILRSYLIDNPTEIKGYMALARLQKFFTYNMKTRCEALKTIYSQTYASDPQDPEVLFEIGWGLFLGDDLHGARLAYNKAEFLADDIPYDKYLDMMIVSFENLAYGSARENLEKAIAKMPFEEKVKLTDIEKIPNFLANQLFDEYKLDPSRFVDPSFIPEDQKLYIKQLYHFATVWNKQKNRFKRLQPIYYSDNNLFEPPYLLFNGLHNHLDYCFHFLLNYNEKTEFLSLTSQHERNAYRERWFRLKDPTPADDIYEVKEEFFNRINFVYEEFKILPNKFEKEWHAEEYTGFDDRGKVYLKYGHPGENAVYIDPGGIANAETMGNPFETDRRYTLSSRNDMTQVKANQSWIYRNLDSFLTFDFVEMNDGYFTYVESLNEATIGKELGGRLYLQPLRAELGGPYQFLYNHYQDQLEKIDTRDESINYLDSYVTNDEQLQAMVDELITKGYGDLFSLEFFENTSFLHEFIVPELLLKNEVTEKYPTSIVDVNKPKKRLPVLLDWATFRGYGGKTRVEIYSVVEYRNLDFSKESDNKFLAFVEYNAVIKDKDILPVVSDTAFTSLLLESKDLEQKTSTFNQFNFEVEPEDYHLFFTGRNVQGEKETSLQIDTNIRDYSGDSLMISDVQLSYKIEPAAEDKSLFVKNDLSVVPYPYRAVNRGDLIYIYFEIYNLTQRPNGTTSYDINRIIEVFDPNNRPVAAIKSLIPGQDKKAETTTTDKRSGNNSFSVEYLAFDMADLMPGRANLTIEIKDNVSGKVTSRTITIDIY